VVDLQAGGAVLAVDEDRGLVAGHGLLTRKLRAFGERGRLEKKEGVEWEAARSSPAASRNDAPDLGARVFTPLVEAAASRPEEGERLHGGGIFHSAGRMSRASRCQSKFRERRLGVSFCSFS